jgi:hypothetical protein
VGAIVTTNGGALAGYLVFKTRRDALADLKAFPPNSGPNKVIARNVAGLPKPSYILKAVGNGYVARYVVFVRNEVIVNTWAYGRKGKASERKLLSLVESNAHWALTRLVTAEGSTTTSGPQVQAPATVKPGATVRFPVSGFRAGSRVSVVLAPADRLACCSIKIVHSFAVTPAGTATLVFQMPTTYRRCNSLGNCTRVAWRPQERVVVTVSGYLQQARTKTSIGARTS